MLRDQRLSSYSWSFEFKILIKIIFRGHLRRCSFTLHTKYWAPPGGEWCIASQNNFLKRFKWKLCCHGGTNIAGLNLILTAHFLLRWRATSDFLNPSRLKRRFAKRLAAATSAWRLPLVRVSLLLRPSLSLRSWSTSGSEAIRAFSLLKQVRSHKYFWKCLPVNNNSTEFCFFFQPVKQIYTWQST